MTHLAVVDNNENDLDGDVPRAVQIPATSCVLTDSGYTSLCDVLRNPEYGNYALQGWPLRFNEMTQLISAGGRVFENDSYFDAVRERLGRCSVTNRATTKFSIRDVFAAINQLAKESSYHPVREYLQETRWDSTPRIDDVPETIMRIEGDEFNTVMLRKCLISAVARVFEPGCKVDTCLILAGPPNIGKSTFFSILAGPDWFCDTAIDISNIKDSALTLAGCWFLEWGEMETLIRSDPRGAKRFLSSQVDKVRPPYGKTLNWLRRTSVVVGTTNDDDFLVDPTGNRRFPIIKCTDKTFNFELLKMDRDQLWAEAVAAYKSGEKWELTNSELFELGLRQKEFERRDPWEDDVLSFIALKEKIRVKDCLEQLGKPAGAWEQRDERRIGSILRKAGWEKKRMRVSGDLGMWWSPKEDGVH